MRVCRGHRAVKRAVITALLGAALVTLVFIGSSVRETSNGSDAHRPLHIAATIHSSPSRVVRSFAPTRLVDAMLSRSYSSNLAPLLIGLVGLAVIRVIADRRWPRLAARGPPFVSM